MELMTDGSTDWTARLRQVLLSIIAMDVRHSPQV
jgi:hypothetical protein